MDINICGNPNTGVGNGSIGTYTFVVVDMKTGAYASTNSGNTVNAAVLTGDVVGITSARKLLTNRSYGVSYHLCSG